MTADRLSLFRNVVPPPRSRAPLGRGSALNPQNRYQRLHVEPLDDPAWAAAGENADAQRRVPTTYFEDASRSVIARNDSPDVGFETSVNPYRGCEHGCVYCYARPTHEYLGFSSGLDFESRILVKSDVAALLRAELSRESWKPRPVAMSGVTDPYQPVERRLQLTRGCLAVLAEFCNPVCVVTKSQLVTRDLDLLAPMAELQAACVSISLTTLNARLARALEPRAPGPAQRLHAIHALADAGVPVGVMVSPVIPGLTDPEIPAILEAAAVAGASYAGYAVLRLPAAVQAIFLDWLERLVPERKEKVVGRLRALRGGALDDARFHARMRGDGPYAEQIEDLFHLGRRKAGLRGAGPALSTDSFRPPAGQLQLF